MVSSKIRVELSATSMENENEILNCTLSAWRHWRNVVFVGHYAEVDWRRFYEEWRSNNFHCRASRKPYCAAAVLACNQADPCILRVMMEAMFSDI